MQIKYLSAKSAEKLMTEFPSSQLLIDNTKLSESYKDLSVELRKIRAGILGLKAAQPNYKFDHKKYDYDLEFGLEMYSMFKEKYSEDFSLRNLSNNSFWIYLSVSVIPDIVAERWGENNQVRSYKTPRRIWLSSLWWYIHLSWQGDKESTREVLLENSTDHILNLVERAGRGYDKQLYRSIMYYYSKLSNDLKVINNRPTFRGALVLNTMHIKIVEPQLMDGGYDIYVLHLFEKLGLKYIDDKFIREG